MRLQEVLRTCSNAHVARAALLSIGGALGAAAAADARRRDEPLGEFVSGLVRDFEVGGGTVRLTRASRRCRRPSSLSSPAFMRSSLQRTPEAERLEARPRGGELLVA